ncbi:Ribosomal RNA small subunit methyltransferase B [Sporomusa acidovorans DSM 3132]|uniref:16S rRNA (cytosine(967)-C(5))-methyltransferase n=2 Tax=Sporomusa TaxID=2375 RepID=A0ABZ3J3A3_SPOA4|nr:ribosomal RNA small subunit methyltransferase B [Sporomusa acidovorans DSM 3132]SDD41473.1 NusB antitermination factor [Sporomusa acidovorans]
MTKNKMDAREIALKVLNEVEGKGAYANIALAQELNRRALQEKITNQDRRFITELVYGTVKTGATLDWMLSCFLSRPLAKVAPIIKNILRLGMYQLFYLEKVPASAACNQAVELARKYGHAGTIKFVNGVLRNAARCPEKIIFPEKDKYPVKYLALKYYHPEWLIERWVNRLGIKVCEDLCQANNTTPVLSVRTNTLKIEREALLTRLTAEGVRCQASKWTPEGILLHEHPSLITLNSLQEGLFQVQDESSMLVAHILGPQPGDFIIDACGAPGGKTTHIAALMKNTGKVLSTDIYEHKLALTRENAERLSLSNIETKVLDAVNLGSMYPLKADKVLVDAPCSGLGVLRRKPDSRWRKTKDILQDLPKLQAAILASAAQCVRPDGVLVYSTCTTEPEENQNIVNSFLQENPAFSLEPAGQYLPMDKKTADNMLQLWPHIDNVDGFFIARMRRRN